jgi:ClpP class serine protease
MRGIDLELFKAGKFKAMGIPGKPLNDEERAFIQEDIDRINSRFVGTVQAARPGIAREDLEGQVFDGDTALAKGFTDSKSRNLAAMLRQLESRPA